MRCIVTLRIKLRVEVGSRGWGAGGEGFTRAPPASLTLLSLQAFCEVGKKGKHNKRSVAFLTVNPIVTPSKFAPTIGIAMCTMALHSFRHRSYRLVAIGWGCGGAAIGALTIEKKTMYYRSERKRWSVSAKRRISLNRSLFL